MGHEQELALKMESLQDMCGVSLRDQHRNAKKNCGGNWGRNEQVQTVGVCLGGGENGFCQQSEENPAENYPQTCVC